MQQITWSDELLTLEQVRTFIKAGIVPRPNTSQQAILLLDAVMGDDVFIDELYSSLKQQTELVKDVCHMFVQDQIGWGAYFAARQTRTIRSGSTGISSVVRQVTGSQIAERFQDNGR